jgi:hypothetical protein
MRVPTTAAGGAAPARGEPAPRQDRLARLRAGARQLPALARQHWAFTLPLAAGLMLRILAQIAYRPALIYIDSSKYLLGNYPGDDPPGYQFAIKPVLAVGNLDMIAVIQHLLGLAMAVTLYLLLLRRGAPRWLSALACVPVLLDGYQVQIEQTVMPDVMFEALIVAGLAALLWSRRPVPWMTAAAGLAFGASATARQIGEIFIVPALGYLLIVIPGWRNRLKHAGLLCLAFALPILAASYRNYADPQLHSFSLAPYASGSIYGRIAEAANCTTLQVPTYERHLCPDAAQKLRLGPDGLDHNAVSPIRGAWIPSLSPADYQTLKQLCPKSVPLTPGSTQYHVVASMCGRVTSNFDRRVLVQQPLNVVASVAKDAVKLFALHRATSPGDVPIDRWQFQPSYPTYGIYVSINSHGVLVFGGYNHDGVRQTVGTGAQFRGGNPVVIRPVAAFLHGYQFDGGYTPGPLFALALLAGLAGSLVTLRRRAAPAMRAAALGCLLFTATGVLALLASDVFEFSWRYQLPALITLPPAAALAVAMLLRRGSPAPAGPEMVPDPLEPGHRGRDDQAERKQDQQGQPGAGLHHDDARGDRADHEGGQDPQAAGQTVRLAAGHQPGDEGRESAGQIGR